MKVIAVVQARMGSSRLPGKMMMPLAGKPVVQHVLERVAMIGDVDQVVLATSDAKSDDSLAEFCEGLCVDVFRGSEQDVLDRFYQAAKRYNAEVVIRVTGDCPLLDPLESDKVVRKFLSEDVDYVSNTNPPMLPDGLDTEVMSMTALEKTWRDATKLSEREHVTYFIYTNPDKFKVASLLYEKDLSHYRWTLDEQRDLDILNMVYDELSIRNQFGHLNEVLDILKDNPEIVSINSSIERNEGLAASLKKDKSSDE